MADGIEQQLEATLNDARAAAEVADEQLAVAQGKVDEMLAQARGNRAERRDEVKRIEKTLKAYRGEPLTNPAKRKNGQPDVSDELKDRVYEAAKQLAAEDEDGGFTITPLNKLIQGVGRDDVLGAVEAMRYEEPPRVRPAGRRKAGPLYKLWAD